MAALTLRSLLSRRSPAYKVVAALIESGGNRVGVVDVSGALLVGAPHAIDAHASMIPIAHEDTLVGHVVGAAAESAPIASLLNHLWAKEIESRSMGVEVLHLYREVHLIEQLSEQLAQVLDLPAIGTCALDQAQRLIKATFGAIYLQDAKGLAPVASFGEAVDPSTRPDVLPLVMSVLQKGAAEIVNDCGLDQRLTDAQSTSRALICAPLRSGENTRGAIILASEKPGAAYSSPDLKLLNTIALQTAAAVDNAMLCAEMVESARQRAAFAAELQAASTVQQLLLQGASRSIAGFHVKPIYIPASEVGGDFYLVYPAQDGSLVAIVGDVSGKGLTAAMRVALILGALRRETSCEPASILAGLNNALVAQGQLGFTTAVCLHVSQDGDFAVANAGHISPYIDGREFETDPALPLGLIADQVYPIRRGHLGLTEQIVLMSDGVPEARSASGELYGFSRLADLARGSAEQIAEVACGFGQEDDITVLSIRLGNAVLLGDTAESEQCGAPH